MKLLDLFCGAGGAGHGYQLAGFDVTGVDVHQHFPPYPFILANALTVDLGGYDAYHASPPCQAFSDLAYRSGLTYPELIEPIRERLAATGKPYVIENVPEAPLINPAILCGTMFPGLRVIRHRAFETNWPLTAPPHPPPPHPLVFTYDRRKRHCGRLDQNTSFVQVTGGGNCTIANARDAMGITWMNKAEINEAIPPRYTQLIGTQLMRHLTTVHRGIPTMTTRGKSSA